MDPTSRSVIISPNARKQLDTKSPFHLVMISSIVTGGLQMILLFLLLKAFPLWNPGFATELELYLGGQDGTGLNEIITRWNGDFVSNCFLAF